MAAKKTAAEKKLVSSERDKKTLVKIERLAHEALKTVTKGSNPALEIRTRALSNVSFNQKKRIIELGDRTQSREFFNTSMARKYMQTFLVANGCKTLIGEGKTVSIRQMFYMTKHNLPGTNENTFAAAGWTSSKPLPRAIPAAPSCRKRCRARLSSMF